MFPTKLQEEYYKTVFGDGVPFRGSSRSFETSTMGDLFRFYQNQTKSMQKIR